MEIGSQQDLFDIPSTVAYFNTAYNAPLLNTSRSSLINAARAKSWPWERTSHDFFADANELRELAADLFGADAHGYAVLPAASYGLSTAARAIEPTLRRGDKILVMAEDFPSNILPWRRVAKETGAEIVTVATPNDGDWTQAITAQIKSEVRVAALAQCHWTDGAVIDLPLIAEHCRASQTAMVLDLTQSLGAVGFDMDSVRPDFLVAAGYKWLLCPYGVGLMYVAPHWRAARPLEESWLARANAHDFTGLVRYSDEYLPGARRFDVGETCVTTVLPGAIAALRQISAWGIDAISASLNNVNEALALGLRERGFEVPKHRSPHMFGARMPACSPADLVTKLREKHVYVSQRGSSVRFAPHLHVTEGNVDQLFHAIDGVIGA